jgi:NADPH-dependent F420 reductase
MRIAIVGGTGPFGRALAQRLIEAGDDVVIGSRQASRAEATATALGAIGRTNEEAVADTDLVVLAVDAGAVLACARSLRPLLQTAPVLSVASELEFAEGSARPVPATHSLAERISDVLDVPVVAGLHSLAARTLVRSPPDEDALVCGNDREAKALALELADKVVAGRAIDAGPLAVARALEAMTAVLVNVNRRYKTHAGLRVTGLP